MILAELEIQDYKQFHGVHRFAPPPEGVIAIIGHNGAGKTTLFEAIEWCLFQPRSIGSIEVPTRGQAAKPRVRVVLLDPETGIRYVIIRSLKRGLASAEIYLEHDPESRVVEGSRQVTEHVARKLIGLSHSAFVSTFFTRQKELSFFGSLSETDRRREVGRLLGMETIREAQKQVNEERQVAQRDAAAALAAWQSESADRDFGAELEAADLAVDARTTFVSRAEAEHAAAVAAHDAARQHLEALRVQQQQDAACAQSIARASAAHDAASKRRDAALSELTRLDREASRRTTLVDQAAQIPVLQANAETQEALRDAYAKQARLREQIDRAIADEVRDAQTVGKTVHDSGVVGFPGWSFDPNVAVLPGALDSLIATVERTDAAHAQQHAISLTHAVDLEKRCAAIDERLIKFRGAVESLSAQKAQLLFAGDPHELMVGLETKRRALHAETEQGNAAERGFKAEIGKVKPVSDRLRQQQLGDVCPTCQRAYTVEDLTVMLPLLESQLADAQLGLNAIAAARQTLAKQISALECQIQELAARGSEIAVLAGRIAEGGKRIDAEQRDFEDAGTDLRRHLVQTGLPGVPKPEEVAAAAELADKLNRITHALAMLKSLRGNIERRRDERNAAERASADIGVVIYDPAVHKDARGALERATSAAAAIQEIERQLAMRPQRERESAAAAMEIAESLEARDSAEQQRRALGFDPDALQIAVAAERERLTQERQSQEARASAASLLDQARNERSRMAEEHQRIARLAERSDVKSREADVLREMYEEFNGFEQFVARRIAPALAESTADLLRAVTDSRYDNVEVTDSYGIRVFDGPAESFPIDQFSGGERDVIALCARLALSRLIGGQAAHPPGFLVLDEVFGSLDRDRRHQVLETLGTLSSATDAFKQLFIISHVDDVRSSPIFNEVWRISEDSDGVSRLENLTVTGGFEE